MSYVNAGMRPSIAVQILGIELPSGIEPKMLDEEPEERPSEKDEYSEEMAKWYRKSVKSIEKGKSANVEFFSVIIPDNEIKRISSLLDDCTTVDEVSKVFKDKPIKDSVDFLEW